MINPDNAAATGEDGRTCPVCSSTNMATVRLDLPMFSHWDFSVVRQSPNDLIRCGDCGIVFLRLNDDERFAVDDIYRSSEYLMRRNSIHMIQVNEHPEPVSFQFLQAEILAPFLRMKKPAILDIGCFNGGFLREMDDRLENADLCGFDVNEDLREFFPEGPNLRYVAGSLSSVEGSFDLIVFSHALQYIWEIRPLMDELARLLAPGGAVYVQAPNFSVKPASLLLADKHYHYTPSTLANVFAHFGWSFTPLDNEWFPRDVIGTARPGGGTVVRPPDDTPLDVSIDYLTSVARTLSDLKARSGFGILGTTAEGSLANSILGASAKFFVDENPAKVEKLFQGKPVIHPCDLTPNDTVIIPYGVTAESLKAKFSARYRGEFINV